MADRPHPVQVKEVIQKRRDDASTREHRNDYHALQHSPPRHDYRMPERRGPEPKRKHRRRFWRSIADRERPRSLEHGVDRRHGEERRPNQNRQHWPSHPARNPCCLRCMPIRHYHIRPRGLLLSNA
jgi:hypothetical protein